MLEEELTYMIAKVLLLKESLLSFALLFMLMLTLVSDTINERTE